MCTAFKEAIYNWFSSYTFKCCDTPLSSYQLFSSRVVSSTRHYIQFSEEKAEIVRCIFWIEKDDPLILKLVSKYVVSIDVNIANITSIFCINAELNQAILFFQWVLFVSWYSFELQQSDSFYLPKNFSAANLYAKSVTKTRFDRTTI